MFREGEMWKGESGHKHMVELFITAAAGLSPLGSAEATAASLYVHSSITWACRPARISQGSRYSGVSMLQILFCTLKVDIWEGVVFDIKYLDSIDVPFVEALHGEAGGKWVCMLVSGCYEQHVCVPPKFMWKPYPLRKGMWKPWDIIWVKVHEDGAPWWD